MEALSSIVTALLGGFVSSGLITYSLGARRSEREVLRNKLENLYAEMSQNIRHLHVAAGQKVTDVWKIENGFPPTESADDADQTGPTMVDKHLTILAIYFPGAAPSYRRFIGTCQKINGIAFEAGMFAEIQNEPQPPRHEEIKEIFETLSVLSHQVGLDLLHEADKINCPLWRRPLLKRRRIV